MAKRVSSLGHRHTGLDLNPQGKLGLTYESTAGVRNSTLTLYSGNPQLSIEDTGAAADEGVWNIIGGLTSLKIRALSDDYATAADVMSFNRGTGATVTDVSFSAPVAVNTGSGNSTITIESSTGDAALYIKADTDNNNENDNPFIRFEQDANQAQMVVGLTGDANKDAQGNTFTNCSANAASIHQLFSGGTVALGIGGSVGLKISSGNDATFYGNVTIDGGNKLKTLDSGNDDSVGVYCDGARGWLTPLDQTSAYQATCVSGATTTSSWPGFQVLDVRLVADDATESWSLLVDGGVYIVTSGSTSATENSCLFAQWSGGSAQNTLASSGGVWSLGAGSNPDVDTNHNIWFTNSGATLNIKNRRGTARYYMVYVFSGRN